MEDYYGLEMHHSFSYEDKKESDRERDNVRKRLYLGEIIEKEDPKFETNNLILAPVGSGKTHLIENTLIPEDFEGNALYLVSTTSLKESIAPDDSKQRMKNAKKGRSKGFYTSKNKETFGDVGYKVHVMTYHEFGSHILLPTQTFTDNYSIIFCDEIHSVEIYANYMGGGRELFTASRWLFEKHSDKVIYYFTATNHALLDLEKRYPGYLKNVDVFDYLEHPNIVKYQAKSKYYISNIHQLKNHLEAKIDYINDRGHKGIAFTRRISSQRNISEIAEITGYKPIIIWSTNNKEEEMSEEQLRVREYVLRTGNIPDPYNLLIINSAMQEGWNLTDKYVEFAILDTLDKTEQIQALGRVRKDIDFLILKVKGDDVRLNSIIISDNYLDTYLTTEAKSKLVDELDIKNDRGRQVKWTTIKKLAKRSGYIVEDKLKTIDGKRVGVSIIKDNRKYKVE